MVVSPNAVGGTVVLRVSALFDPELGVHPAKCRRAALACNTAFQADPDMSRAWGKLGAAKFDPRIA
jgi:hypothetical protein